ncbi:MAG: metallophosphoesterase [Lachnospiraceae bacterium]|nr:metallophosphoesterase [Lachnospiraceae bacterium]
MTNNTAAWKAEVEDTAAKLQALAEADSLIIPIYTDLHTSSLKGESFRLLIQGLKEISAIRKPNAVISLGDNLSMLGRTEHASNARIRELLTGIFDQTADAVGDVPCYILHGNHDGLGTDFFDREFWYSIVGNHYDNQKARREGHSAYFYVDEQKSHSRLIFLSLPSGSDVEAELPTPLWEFGDIQLKWLAETALNPESMQEIQNIILFCHVPFTTPSESGVMTAKLGVWTGVRAAESYIKALCGWISDREEAEKILKAYASHTAYHEEKRNIHADYTAAKAPLIACISGHNHNDRVILPGQQNGTHPNHLPCPQILIGGADPRVNPELREQIQIGVSMDILIFTPSKGRLSLIRLGDGEDREYAAQV